MNPVRYKQFFHLFLNNLVKNSGKISSSANADMIRLEDLIAFTADPRLEKMMPTKTTYLCGHATSALII